FPVPVQKDSQYWFAFTYDGQRYTYTRLPQEADTAFGNIKQVLVSSTALELPDYINLLTSVLVQQHGDKMKPVAYFSSKLNGVACVLPHCVRTPIAASMAVEVTLLTSNLFLTPLSVINCKFAAFHLK
uniref:Uncharacterized protein n=1 Tax=Oryzias latipes TaxID=8090 RepID=A0A3P9M5M1_ORYLA